jgi:multicomponent Na+:H+ antiporter subunit E
VRHLGFAIGFPWRAAAWRLAAFLALWLILIGGPDPADRPAGIVAILTATWASLRLLPPGQGRVAPMALARLALRFFRQSLVAGWDIAWRALNPRLLLRPGFVVYS